jgi:predicted dehydrogenase
MKNPLNRRSFLKRAALATSALSAQQLFFSPSILHAANRGEKVRCVIVGCGGRGGAHLSAIVPDATKKRRPAADDESGEDQTSPTSGEHLVALVDVDETRHAKYKELVSGRGRDASKIETFTDYRRMFDKLHKQIDAVFVATPNHHHALPSMIAMQLGKGIYCEKPLCHDIAEARRLAEMARQYKVATQMGNQGHCMDGYRRLCEYVWAGAIGQITETHSWTDRANGGIGPRPAPQSPPPRLHWDEWIGPAPYRPYHQDLHPHEWHGWHDFGNGSLGNLACHVLDGVHWSLKLEHPTSIEVEEMFGGNDERYPTGTRIRWDFPQRGDMAAVKTYWYDGRVGAGDPGDGNKSPKGKKGPRNLPPLLVEMQKKYPQQKYIDSGTFYVGEKGIFYTSTYGQEMHLMPKEKMDDIPAPPRSLPRPKGSFADFLRACREGKTDTASSFIVAARLTEFVLLGNLAQHAGKGNKVEWNGPEMKVTNLPELNRFVTREYRKGWEQPE